MTRLAFALVLLQGSLFTAITGAATTPKPQPGLDTSHPEEVDKTPLYQFGNKADEPCILMQMEAYVSIKWEVGTNETKEIDMFLEPSKVLTTGSCTADEANLSLTWKSFHLRWNFAKTRDWVKWFAKQVELQYDKSGLDNRVVNGTTGMSTVSTRGSSEVMLFSAPIGGAYHCPSEYELELKGDGADSATLRLRNFRVQPFLSKPSFGPNYCPSHTTGVTFTTTTTSVSSVLGVTKTDNRSPTGTSVQTNRASASPLKSTGTPGKANSSNAPRSHANFAVTSPSHPAHDVSAIPRSTAFTPSQPHTTRGTRTTANSAVTSPSSVSTYSLPDKTTHFGVSVRTPSSLAEETSTRFPFTDPPTTMARYELSSPPPTGLPLPPYAYQKAFPDVFKMPFYPPKKGFSSGEKMDENNYLSSMIWSWYTSGFYTGYYQAQKLPKKIY